MRATIDVTDCRDCPFAEEHSGQGECWTHCTHNDTDYRSPYDCIIWGCREEFTAIPDWCPLKKQEPK
jgi:hypothetical protein